MLSRLKFKSVRSKGHICSRLLCGAANMRLGPSSQLHHVFVRAALCGGLQTELLPFKTHTNSAHAVMRFISVFISYLFNTGVSLTDLSGSAC